MQIYNRRSILKILGATALFATPCATAFASQRNIAKETRTAMDTFVSIEVRHDNEEKRAKALHDAFTVIDSISALFDRYNPSSPLSTLNRTGKLYDVSPELLELFVTTKQIAGKTKHMFNPTVTPLVDYILNANTFDIKQYRDIQKAVSTMDSVRVDKSAITLQHQDMKLTLDGIAKGYIIDRVAMSLQRNGIEHYLINAGGDIALQGFAYDNVPWTIAIQSPYGRQEVVSTFAFRRGAVATSGGYQRFNNDKRDYTHIINPYTARSPQRNKSVTVIAPNTMLADALATTISCMNTKDAFALVQQIPQSACYIITESYHVESPLWSSLTV